jgi:hypothetical protein
MRELGALPDEDADRLTACLSRLLGRTDTTTEAFVVDCRRSLRAYFRTRSGDSSNGLPAAIEADLTRIERETAALRSSLYGLPAEIAALVDLHLLGADQQRRIAHDVSMLETPLEDLAAAIQSLRLQASKEQGLSPALIRDRLLRALGNAYRNHFNLLPKLEPESPFRAVLEAVLEPVAAYDPALAMLLMPEGEALLQAAFRLR